MPKTNQLHTVPNPKGGWDNKKTGAGRASSHHDTKAEAVERAKEIAKNQGLEHITHNRDGRISNPNSYGNDPCPPKDKNWLEPFCGTGEYITL